jgi:hypothetical protein
MRKIILAAAAIGALGFAAFASVPAQAGALHSTTGLVAPQIETDVTTVQHWRWGSRRHWRWGSWGPRPHWRWGSWGPRPCIWVHTRSWSRWRCR